MANQSFSSASVILCASFNQDNSCFAIGTRDGFKIFNCNTGKVFYERAIGAFSIVEMLYGTSLLAIVGAGEQASLSPRRLCLFNTVSGTALRELNFLTSIIAVRLNRKRLIVVLQEKTFIYDSNSIAILDTVDTVPNAKGLCAFSPSLDGCYLALPASTTKGSVLVYNVMELQLHCEIDAHRSPLVAIALSSNGMYIATASEQGTIIRVHLVSQATKSYSFRRGTYPSTIYSLSFGPSTELPDILTATSSSGSIHAFFLGFILDQRSKRSSSLLGSMIPNLINDAFEPGFHHVFRNANPPGVKSYATIRSIDKVASTSVSQIATSNRATIRSMDNVSSTSISQVATFKACISIITDNGYFQEYSLSFDHIHEPFWELEREFNLLKAAPDNVNN